MVLEERPSTMNQYLDDTAPREANDAAQLGEEAELVRRAGAGEEEAFSLLYDRYFARISWYFTIFAKRKAKTATAEVMRELFGTLGEPSELSFAEQAFGLARAAELRHGPGPASSDAGIAGAA